MRFAMSLPCNVKSITQPWFRPLTRHNARTTTSNPRGSLSGLTRGRARPHLSLREIGARTIAERVLQLRFRCGIALAVSALSGQHIELTLANSNFHSQPMRVVTDAEYLRNALTILSSPDPRAGPCPACVVSYGRQLLCLGNYARQPSQRPLSDTASSVH